MSLALAEYNAAMPCWSGGAVPYAHLAAALDALEATRSRLAKELVLTNVFRAMLTMKAAPAEIAAACYLLAPAKDAQAGGHRLKPEWHAASGALGISKLLFELVVSQPLVHE